MFDIEQENARIASGGPKFSINQETEVALRRRFHLKAVELACNNSACLFNKGGGLCGHIEPNVELRFMKRKDGMVSSDFICWSTAEKAE